MLKCAKGRTAAGFKHTHTHTLGESSDWLKKGGGGGMGGLARQPVTKGTQDSYRWHNQ